MAFTPPQTDDPAKIVDSYAVEARQGVWFGLYCDDVNLAYLRMKTFAVSDPIETVVVPRHEITNVTLTKLNPVGMRIGGVAFIAATFAGVGAFMAGVIDRFPFVALGGLVIGGAMLMSASNRWRLSFEAQGKTHTLTQPAASDAAVASRLAQCLQSIGTALGANAALR